MMFPTAIISLWLLFAGPAQSHALDGRMLPTEVGTSWIYRGTVRWNDTQSHEIKTKSITMRSELLRVLQRQDVGATLFLVHGSPSDYDWSEGVAEPSDWLLVETAKGQVYRFDGGEVSERLIRFEDQSDALRDFFDANHLILRLPLRIGAKACDEESRARMDGDYCWIVASKRVAVIGFPQRGDATEKLVFLLRFITNPDDVGIEFAAGVGIVSYQYHHHGTIADTRFRLIEMHGPTAGKSEMNPK